MLKNKIPKLWVYNAGIDKTWQTESQGIRKINNPKEQYILNAQSELNIFLCKKDDYLIVIREPDREFINDISTFGIEKPTFIKVSNNRITISEILENEMNNTMELSRLNGKNIVYSPYILSKIDENNAKRLNLHINGKNSVLVKQINNKTFIRELSMENEFPRINGYVCRCKDELLHNADLLIQNGCERFCIKEPYNSAGKGVFFIRDKKQLDLFAKRMQFGGDDFSVILEEWIDNKKDINYQIEILENGDIDFIGITEQIINTTAYKGTAYPADISLEQEKEYKRYASKIGGILYEMGFTGVIGIDSIIIDDNRIIPMIEINARINQSTFYLKLGKYFKERNKRIIFRSYDINTKCELNYKILKQYLINKGLYFDGDEGTIIINSSCLSIFKNCDETYFNRVYLAYVGKEKAKNEELMESINNVIDIIKQI